MMKLIFTTTNFYCPLLSLRLIGVETLKHFQFYDKFFLASTLFLVNFMISENYGIQGLFTINKSFSTL